MRVRALLGTRLTVASGIVLAVVTAAAVQGIGSWLPIEANLRHVEDPRSAPIVELRRKGEDGVLDVHPELEERLEAVAGLLDGAATAREMAERLVTGPGTAADDVTAVVLLRRPA